MEILFNYYALTWFTPFIINLALIIYLLTLKGKDKNTWFLGGYFFFTNFISASYFFLSSLASSAGAKLTFAMVCAVVLAIPFLIVFSYNFPRNIHPRESKYGSILASLIAVVGYGHFAYVYLSDGVYFNRSTHFFMGIKDIDAQSLIYTPVIALLMTWALVVLIRKTITFSMEHAGVEKKGNFFARIPGGFKHFFRPSGKEAKSLLAFSYAAYFTIIIGTTYSLYTLGLISFANYQFFSTISYTLLFFTYMIIYVNNSPQPTTFMVKLVGISLVTLLLIINLTSRLSFDANEKVYETNRTQDIQAIKHALSVNDLKKIPENVSYLAVRPNDKLFSNSYRVILKRNQDVTENFLVEGDKISRAGLIIDTKRSIMGLNNLAPTKAKLEDAETKAREIADNTRISPGMRHYRYTDVSAKKMFFIYYNFTQNNQIYEVGFPYLKYRLFVHEITKSYIYITIAATLFLLIAFPFFFKSGLLDPLNSLLGGVKQVNEGDMSVQVPVRVEDEIGFLARSFNGMVSSIADAREKLQDYANNLEEMVEDRTAELRASKKEIDDIMGNVRQGLMTLTPDGIINEEYSARVDEIFATEGIGGVYFPEMFKTDPETQDKLKRFISDIFEAPWMDENMFKRTNPVADYHYTIDMGFKKIKKVLDFTFYRLYKTDDDGKVDKSAILKIMVVVEDKTYEYELTQELERKTQEHASRVEKLYQILKLDTTVFRNFINDAFESLENIKEKISALGDDPVANKDVVEESFRVVHNLKGNARALNLDTVSQTAHSLEEKLTTLREAKGNITPAFKNQAMEGINVMAAEIQDGNSLFNKIMNMRDAFQVKDKDPVREFENTMRRIIQKEAESTNKSIDFSFKNLMPDGVPEKVLKEIKDPIMQIMRNAVDHGVEQPDMRKSRGKPEIGQIKLQMSKEDDNNTLLISCEDDGNGLNPDLIKKKALEKNFITPEEASKMTKNDIYRLIFLSGLSTAPRVTETSGRGVGMDIVKAALRDLGAAIIIKSEPGQFTRFVIKVFL